ncbi:endosome-associated-trafficking regulator 1 [Gastrophryne carolinensis]
MSGPSKAGRRAKTLIIEDDCDTPPPPPDEANPFSFKEFVKSKNLSRHCDGEFPQDTNLNPDGNKLDHLPDYQETFFKDPTIADDFPEEDDNEEEEEDWSGSYQPSVIEQSLNVNMSQGSVCDDSYQYSNIYAGGPFTTWLPNGGSSPLAPAHSLDNTVNSSLGDLHFHTLQIHNEELQQENKHLKLKVQELKKLNESQAEKLMGLQRSLEERILEEQKEAQDLESMVQQVEANLQMMTKRASKAESHVTKLKQEVALLQVQLSTYKGENEALRRGETAGMNAVKHNANMALESLHKAVSGAQASIKQLVSGAEALNLVAELLKSIDKIAEVHDDVS